MDTNYALYQIDLTKKILEENCRTLERSNAALRGVITKLKKQLKESEAK